MSDFSTTHLDLSIDTSFVDFSELRVGDITCETNRLLLAVRASDHSSLTDWTPGHRVACGMPKVKQEPELIDLTESEESAPKSPPAQQPAHSKGSGTERVDDVIKLRTKRRKKGAAVQLKRLRTGMRMDETCAAIRQRIRQNKNPASVRQLEKQQQEENEKIRMLIEARKLDATRTLTLGGTRI